MLGKRPNKMREIMSKVITIADLFCGAGGTSTGAVEAVEMLGHTANLTAVNHWTIAIATHTANHPNARHLCASLDSLNPRDLFKDGELDLLWASPECTHHSVARGGKPINDQSRATAWCVARWAEALRPTHIIVENVPEFLTWGPIGSDGRPIASRKGAIFRKWCETLETIGYRVEHRILVAADYGDPTTRRRLFVQAVRDGRRVVWPDATHAANGADGRKPWTPARDIIDWNLPSESIYTRKRPLKPNTLRRIEEGLRRFGFAPSIIAMEHGGGVKSVDKPLPTVTCSKGGSFGVAMPILEPMLLGQQSGATARPVSQPSPTVATAGAIRLIEPFLVEYYGNGGASSVDKPLKTVTTKERHGLVMPVVEVDGERYLLDIRFRMLQPRELALAQGFRRDYTITGTKTEQTRQIGNAVPRRLARALVLAAISQNPDISKHLNDTHS